MTLKPYPEYKDSGVPWLGKVPAHWEMRRFRSILSPISERNNPDLPLLSVVREKGIIKRDITNNDENHNYIPDDLSNYKVVRVGQFAMNKMKAWQGSYGISMFDGIVSPAYYVFRLHGILSDFFHRAVRSKVYIPFFTQASDGIRVGQWDLSLTRMKEIPFWIPTETEQTQVARFLDYKSSQIARFIRTKKRMIELLKEQKQAIINQAVTRGLDSNVKLKSSGVDWLGDIPEHWQAKRIKLLYRNVADQTGNKNPDDIYIALEHVESWTGKLTLPEEEIIFESQVKKFYSDDILFGKLRPYLAKVLRPNCSGVCVGEFLVLRDYSEEVSPAFMEVKLRATQIIDLINSSTFGAKMPRADWTFMGSILFSYPELEEQKIIVNKLTDDVKQRDILIEKAEREIALIQEYRTRLISDVVTGKVDVRNIKVEDVTDEELVEEIPVYADLPAVSTAQAGASAGRGKNLKIV